MNMSITSNYNNYSLYGTTYNNQTIQKKREKNRIMERPQNRLLYMINSLKMKGRLLMI